MDTNRITVHMTETCEYDHSFTADELADMFGDNAPDRDRILTILNDGTTDEDTEALLDAILPHFTGVTDRHWSASP